VYGGAPGDPRGMGRARRSCIWRSRSRHERACPRNVRLAWSRKAGRRPSGGTASLD